MALVSDTLTVLVVDDEPVARDRIRRLLTAVGAIDVRSAPDGLTAVDAILGDQPPDIVFLDVQMPGLDGFGVVERVGPDRMPVTVFVTAFEEHATRAFAAEALDYLVKPYDDQRFLASFERARRRVAEGRLSDLGARFRTLLAWVDPAVDTTAPPIDRQADDASGTLDRIAIRTGDRVQLIRAATIDWIAAEGVYARVYVGSQSQLVRMSMNEMEVRLDPQRFVRVHRSAIVNVDRIRELRETSRGEYSVILESGTSVKLSRSRRAAFERRLGQSL
jgi:two-component system LytT family response regulator